MSGCVIIISTLFVSRRLLYRTTLALLNAGADVNAVAKVSRLIPIGFDEVSGWCHASQNCSRSWNNIREGWNCQVAITKVSFLSLAILRKFIVVEEPETPGEGKEEYHFFLLQRVFQKWRQNLFHSRVVLQFLLHLLWYPLLQRMDMFRWKGWSFPPPHPKSMNHLNLHHQLA